MSSEDTRSPNGEHVASLSMEGEIRFGPPYFTLALDGKALADRTFGSSPLWSSDSKYVFVQEWLSWIESTGPQTVLICFDVQSWRESKIAQIKGWVAPDSVSDGCLTYSQTQQTDQGRETHKHEIALSSITDWQPIKAN